MDLSLKGKIALVGGASQGIGYAIAHLLASEGATVAMVARKTEPLAQACARISAETGAETFAIPADIRKAEDCQRITASALEKFGRIDLLINNDGAPPLGEIQSFDDLAWTRAVEQNLMSVVRLTRGALPSMQENGWGRIVNVVSTAGLVGYAYVSAYCAAKHGVIGLTRALALEVAKKGVTVNAVCPGYTETDILRESIANVVAKTGRSEQEARASFAAGNPQGRIVQPEEVADTVRWLCGNAASAIHGQSISVSGGEVMA